MKHIIDTISEDFDELPQGLRESHAGQILLRIDRHLDGRIKGIVSMSQGDLLKEDGGKTLLERISEDVDDVMGHKKYIDIHLDLVDNEMASEVSSKIPTVAALKSNLQARKLK